MLYTILLKNYFNSIKVFAEISVNNQENYTKEQEKYYKKQKNKTKEKPTVVCSQNNTFTLMMPLGTIVTILAISIIGFCQWQSAAKTKRQTEENKLKDVESHKKNKLLKSKTQKIAKEYREKTEEEKKEYYKQVLTELKSKNLVDTIKHITFYLDENDYDYYTEKNVENSKNNFDPIGKIKQDKYEAVFLICKTRKQFDNLYKQFLNLEKDYQQYVKHLQAACKGIHVKNTEESMENQTSCRYKAKASDLYNEYLAQEGLSVAQNQQAETTEEPMEDILECDYETKFVKPINHIYNELKEKLLYINQIQQLITQLKNIIKQKKEGAEMENNQEEVESKLKLLFNQYDVTFYCNDAISKLYLCLDIQYKK